MFVRTRRHQFKAEGAGALPATLLMAAILLMIALAFAGRSAEQSFLSTQEEDTTRVFNAAESGVEQALYVLDTSNLSDTFNTASDTDIVTSSINNANVTVTGRYLENASIPVRQGETLTIKPTTGSTSTSLSWADPASGNCVGLLVTLYRGANSYHNSFFSQRSSGCGTQENNLGVTLTNPSLSLNITYFGSGLGSYQAGDMIRVTPLFNNITFTGIRAQQIRAEASDSQTTGTSAETRRIELIRTEPGPPAVFDYAVFSGGDLAK